MNETIRLARPEDSAALLAIYRPYIERTAVTFEITPPSEGEFAWRVEQTLAHHPWLVAEAAGRIVGYAYAGPLKAREAYAHSVETSIYLPSDEHGHGLGRRLYEELEARLAKMGVLNLYACITYSEDENDPYLTRDSVVFHEHMGYTRVGLFHDCGRKFGRWYSVVWMEKALGEHR